MKKYLAQLCKLKKSMAEIDSTIVKIELKVDTATS